MKNLKLLLIGLFLLSSFWVGQARAEEGGVNFKANVLERKATDTINDFIWDGQDNSSPPLKEVKGVSTDVPSVSNQPQNIFSKFRWQDLLFLSPVYDVYYIVAHWRELKTRFIDQMI